MENSTENVVKKKMVAGVIYRAKDDCYDEDYPAFACYSPVDYADGCFIGDCWVCDEQGNICPGYNVSPVPVNVEDLGEVIGKFPY